MDYVKTKKNIIETWTPFLTQSFDRYSGPCEHKLPSHCRCFWHFDTICFSVYQRQREAKKQPPCFTWAGAGWLKRSHLKRLLLAPYWCWCQCWQCAEFQYWMLGPPCTHTLNNQTLTQLTHDIQHTFVSLCNKVEGGCWHIYLQS